MANEKNQYWVIAADGPDATNPHKLGVFSSMEKAEQYRAIAEKAGWKRTAILDQYFDKIFSPISSGKKPREDFSQAAARIVREATKG